MALEDRDWYRDEPSKAYLAARTTKRSSIGWRRDSGGRLTGGLALAVAVSGAVAFFNWTGNLPLPDIKLGGDTAARSDHMNIQLGEATGFDVVGPVGRQWCLTVRGPSGTAAPRERVCAHTGSAETGRQALARVLESRGYRVK